MQEIIESGVPEDNFRASCAVRSVEQTGSSVLVTYTKADESTQVIEADRVVIACPKFIAQHIIDKIPEPQAAAISKLTYNAYVVANLLIDQKMTLNQYDIYLLGDQNETFQSTEEASNHQGVTDVIIGQWAQSEESAPTNSVLTLYRPLPYTAGRGLIAADGSFDTFSAQISAQTPSILKALGLEQAAVKEFRFARYGHPLPVAAPALLADGVTELASKPIGGQIFFCNQDNWALPCIESALGAALTAAHQMGELPT